MTRQPSPAGPARRADRMSPWSTPRRCARRRADRQPGPDRRAIPWRDDPAGGPAGL